MHLTEFIWLVHLVSRDPKSSPFKTFMRYCNFCEISGSGFLHFSSLGPNQALDFLKIQPPKKFDPGLNTCALGRHNFLCKKIFQIPNFAETLISSREGGERISPCEWCSNQVSFDTMLNKHNIETSFILGNPQREENQAKIPLYKMYKWQPWK